LIRNAGQLPAFVIEDKVAFCYHGRMSQPVKLSDALVLDARIAGEAQERSIAGQVEFWAKLGRSVELLLDGRQVLSLCRTVGTTPLAELVEEVDTPKGRERLKAYLESEPYPHFEAYPSQPGLLVRIDESGERTVGRFVNRAFVPAIGEDTLMVCMEDAHQKQSYREHVLAEKSLQSEVSAPSEHVTKSKNSTTA
jgi:hypothetical protein